MITMTNDTNREIKRMKRETKTTDCDYCGRFGLCMLVQHGHWMCVDVKPCAERQADRCRAYASGFIANTKDETDGGLVPVVIDHDENYQVCVKCGTDTDNGVLHHGVGCANA